MAGADPANPRLPLAAATSGRSKLFLRVLSSLVMAPLAVGAAYLGDPVFVVFWTIAALGVLWEWDALVCAHDKNPVFTIGSVALAGVALLWLVGRPIPALMMIGLSMLSVATLASRVRRTWCVAGLAYAGVLLIAPVVLRHDPVLGFWAIVYLFAVVWATDIGAYVAGRALGGPKLVPRISPNKTWAGAIGGLIAGIGSGLALAKFADINNLVAIAVLTLILSIVSQAGDLLESAIKRRFDAKDSSWLIPGHGGFMDRLDGFVTAVAVGLLIGLGRGGFEGSARGLLIW